MDADILKLEDALLEVFDRMPYHEVETLSEATRVLIADICERRCTEIEEAKEG